MVCMLNFRIRNQRKQNETENISIIGMDGGTLFRKIKKDMGMVYEITSNWDCYAVLFILK